VIGLQNVAGPVSVLGSENILSGQLLKIQKRRGSPKSGAKKKESHLGVVLLSRRSRGMFFGNFRRDRAPFGGGFSLESLLPTVRTDGRLFLKVGQLLYHFVEVALEAGKKRT
jgi:hypothetical protein